MADYVVTATVPLENVDMTGLGKPIPVFTDYQILNFLERRVDEGIVILEKVNDVIYLKESIGTGIGQTVREAIKHVMRRSEDE